MRIVSLLVGVLLVGLFIMKQLNSTSELSQSAVDIENGGIKTTKIPTSPEGVKKFEEEMNKFIQDTADKRAQDLETLTR